MLALKIIGGILLVVILLLLVRVGCRVDYSADGLVLYLKVACFQLQLIPKKQKKASERQKKQKPKKKKQKDKKEKAEKEENPEKKKGDLKWLLELVKPVLTALGKLRRKLRVDRLWISYAIGGREDPAGAAVKYGVVSAGGGALFPLLNAALTVKDWDVDLSVDFQSDKTMVALSAAGTYRIGQLLAIALSLGWRALSVYRKHQTQSAHKEDVQHGRKASDR